MKRLIVIFFVLSFSLFFLPGTPVLAGNGQINLVTVMTSTITIEGVIDGTGFSNPVNVKVYAYEYYENETVI